MCLTSQNVDMLCGKYRMGVKQQVCRIVAADSEVVHAVKLQG